MLDNTPAVHHIGAILGTLNPAQLAAVQCLVSAAAGAPERASAALPAKKKSRASTIKYLTEDELALLFAAVSASGDSRDAAIFEVAYHRGLRASEVGLLRVGHLRMNAKRLYVTRLKGGISGEYPLTDRELKALRVWIRRRGVAAGPLFPSRLRRPISRQRLDRLMRRYAAAAGLPAEKWHFHCLRHSCATSLIEHDVSMELVQDHLGHNRLASTEIYAKVSDRKRREVGERLATEW